METSKVKGQVDFGIITIREDEFEAVLDRFPEDLGIVSGRRQYNLRRIAAEDPYTVAIVRCAVQANSEAQQVANALLDDLRPRWLLVVGIAGGAPASEFTLGDVVVATEVCDFNVGAVLKDGSHEYALHGWMSHPEVAKVAANLPAMRTQLGTWNSRESVHCPRPRIKISPGLLYGNAEWKKRLKNILERHVAERRQRPRVTAGAIACSDLVMKDTELFQICLKFARQVIAVEMESAGVHKAAQERHVPFMSIRGLSDIVGFSRDPKWTAYACHTAAAFTRAFLLTRPIPQPLIASDQNPGTGDPDVSTLLEIIGARNWHASIHAEDSVRVQLAQTQSSLKFMGFGFHRYVLYDELSGDRALTAAIERCHDIGAAESIPVKILVMNPFSPRIEEYSDEALSPGRGKLVQIRILETLKYIEGFRERGFNVQMRFYPDSLAAKASFRMYIANDKTAYVSYYKARYGHTSDDGQFSEVQIERGTSDGFFLPFHSLFNYLWDAGEIASTGSLYFPLKTSELTTRSSAWLRKNLEVVYHPRLLDLERAVVAAVAGKDSMAAIVEAASRDDVNLIIPLIVKVPTEQEDWRVRLSTLHALRKALTARGVDAYVAPPIVLDDDKGVWRSTNSDWQEHLRDAAQSPCVGCHFYIHAIRCKVAKLLGVTRVVEGARERHGTDIKFNQTAGALDHFIEFAKTTYGVDLQFPLRYEADDEAVWRRLEGIGRSQIRDLTCIFSGKGTAKEFAHEVTNRLRQYTEDVVSNHYKRVVEGE